MLLLWIVLNVFQGVSGLGMRTGGGVAHFAHIGGFFAGVALDPAAGRQGPGRAAAAAGRLPAPMGGILTTGH